MPTWLQAILSALGLIDKAAADKVAEDAKQEQAAHDQAVKEADEG